MSREIKYRILQIMPEHNGSTHGSFTLKQALKNGGEPNDDGEFVRDEFHEERDAIKALHAPGNPFKAREYVILKVYGNDQPG